MRGPDSAPMPPARKVRIVRRRDSATSLRSPQPAPSSQRPYVSYSDAPREHAPSYDEFEPTPIPVASPSLVAFLDDAESPRPYWENPSVQTLPNPEPTNPQLGAELLSAEELDIDPDPEEDEEIEAALAFSHEEEVDPEPKGPVTIPAAPVTQKLVEPHLASSVWEVWIEGSDPVGPVSADQIARGIRTGRIPSHASVKRANDTFWADLLDVPEVVEALKGVSSESEAPPQLLAPNLSIRQYMVWVEGSDPVGPVSADQLARGIRAGKVPAHASVQRVGEFFATDVLDEPDVIAALKQI